jgi:hypothetical protein
MVDGLLVSQQLVAVEGAGVGAGGAGAALPPEGDGEGEGEGRRQWSGRTRWARGCWCCRQAAPPVVVHRHAPSCGAFYRTAAAPCTRLAVRLV